MPYAILMRILYRKGILNEADPVSRRPNFLVLVDNMYKLDESLQWDGKVLDIDTNGNGTELLALSTFDVQKELCVTVVLRENTISNAMQEDTIAKQVIAFSHNRELYDLSLV